MNFDASSTRRLSTSRPSSSGALLLTEPQHHAFALGHEPQRREIAGARGVEFEQEMIDVGVVEEAFSDLLIPAGREVVALEVAAADMNADYGAGCAYHRRIDRTDVKINELVRLFALRDHLATDRRIAQHRQRNLVELDIAAASACKIGNLVMKHFGQIGKESVYVRVDRPLGIIAAAIEMHGGRRRQRDLGHEAAVTCGEIAQERELVERERRRAA